MNLRCFFCVFLTSPLVGQTTCDDDFPVVTITQGSLKGKKISSPDKEAYYGFQGIPYARPPLGDLRFKAPLPHEPWNGTLEAGKEGNICMQFISSQNSTVGSEDCLFINVYTPQLPGSEPLIPVMIWIHPGSFVRGSGNIEELGPEYLLSAGVVYVSLNYRLGVLGFLSTEDGVISGNAGLKDQVLAFRWVQENIAAFGGDPDRVTIAGDSAGGVSVQLHLLSPLTEGLFRGAIAQSGSAFNPFSLTTKARKNALVFGSKLGFSGNSTEDLAQFLRSRNADELVRTSAAIVSAMSVSPLYIPTVERTSGEEEPFLTENPRTLLDEGKFQRVPFMTGATSAEGIFCLIPAGVTSGTRTLQDLDENFVELLKPDVKFCQDYDCAAYILEKVRSFYIEDEALNQKTLNKFIDMCTDFYFAAGIVIGAKRMQPKSNAPIHLYNFVYDGGLANLKKGFTTLRNISGVAHTDDLGYLFNIGLSVEENSTDFKVRSRMVTMWTNFVKTGNPTPEATEDIPEWPPFTVEAGDYLEIGSQLVVKNHMNEERVNFWESLLQLAEDFNGTNSEE
ncbi:juvenile hormone esterase [Anabrus simplex]|uniref:juvenile hormone esterase n=1 Tax=Anabrus simplex TaxID=316456 RepID=UPI0035A39461